MAAIPPAPPFPKEKNYNESFFNSLTEKKKVRINTSCFSDLNLFYKKSITQIEHVPQTGPNCGLAALTMVAMLTPNNMTLNDIFNEAESRGFTNNGEMFSVKNMAILAENVLSPWFEVEMVSDGLARNKPLVVKRLYDGDLVLIPYDADKDHTPCSLGGHKAHWALLCGVMMTTDGEYCVAAMHGKSRHLAVWSLDSLCRSNDNLVELDPSRANDGCDYILPPGGLSAGLANKFIILHKKV